MDILAFQFLLAVLLFFVVNWIGGHSIASGYHQLSVFKQVDEAPAFNLVFRVVAPLVYLVITASLLYTVGLDDLVVGFYRVAVYYVAFRWFFNIVV